MTDQREFGHRLPNLLVGVLFVVAALAASPAVATIISADFSTTSDNAQLLGKTDGSGWAATSQWGASTGTGGNTSRVKLRSGFDLTTAIGGYAVTQTGSGAAFGDYTAFRGINRNTTSLSGDLWFSVLVQNTTTNDHAGIQFNNHAAGTFTGADYNVGPWHVEVAGTDLKVRYNGVDSAALATLPINQTHLLLGKLTIGAGNDTMQVWADPADLNNLGTPLFSQNTADMGGSLALAGIFNYGTADGAKQGYVDALRISDGGGNSQQAFADVTGVAVPEPAALVLLCLGAVSLIARRWLHVATA